VADRYKYFRIEAREILEQLGRGALDLEKGPAADAVPAMLRLAHTLKGAARVVRQPEIGDDAHALEEALDAYRGGGAIPRDTVDRVLALVDDIGRRLAELPQADASGAEPARATPAASAPSGPAAASPDALQRAAVPTAPGSAAEPRPASGRPAMDDLDALLDGVFEAQVRLGSLRPALAEAVQDRPSAALARLTTGIDQLDRELRQVRDAVERLRLTPVSVLFTFLERAVRDVAAAASTRIAFTASGGDVRVDAVVLHTVQGALLHIVRNAAAHGIETADARRRAGKPEEGRIGLTVRQHGRQVTFTCADDGRGIDFDAVRALATRRALETGGSPPADTPALLRALLHGGISTTGRVTDLSGRGIGLDAVREAAERLGGDVALQTEPGAGTSVAVSVPLSVASLPALVVEAAGSAVAIPLDAIERSLRIGPDEIVRTGQHATVLVDGQAIPLAPLASLATAARAARSESGRASAVVVRATTGAAAAFTVDRIVGAAPVLLKPLPRFAPVTAVIAGAALDAVGDPLVVVDPDRLVAGARDASRNEAAAAPARPRVLVIDDSLTTRMLEQSILESAGYEVALATTAEEGLELARASRYALCLVDVEMPGMDGFGFVERIRADAGLKDLPAILVTSRSAPEDRQRGLDVGAQAYIVKGEFDQGVLLDRIKVLVG
jgi:two-component system, chemotaxis family, sensor kinase CheA